MNRVRSTQFVSAVVFLFLAASFTFDGDGVQWMWKDNPIVAAILVAVSLVFWVFFVLRATKSKRSESHG